MTNAECAESSMLSLFGTHALICTIFVTCFERAYSTYMMRQQLMNYITVTLTKSPVYIAFVVLTPLILCGAIAVVFFVVDMQLIEAPNSLAKICTRVF